jgi:acyl-CoA thioester hydrolase
MGLLLKAGHRFAIRVYYEDTDAGGVVYHANYLGFAERARTEALRDLGVPHAQMQREHGLIFMVRRVKLDYLAPARLDDSLSVLTTVTAVRGATVELRQQILLDDRLLVNAELQLACVQAEVGRPGRIPARWRDALAQLCGETEES